MVIDSRVAGRKAETGCRRRRTGKGRGLPSRVGLGARNCAGTRSRATLVARNGNGSPVGAVYRSQGLLAPFSAKTEYARPKREIDDSGRLAAGGNSESAGQRLQLSAECLRAHGRI